MLCLLSKMDSAFSPDLSMTRLEMGVSSPKPMELSYGNRDVLCGNMLGIRNLLVGKLAIVLNIANMMAWCTDGRTRPRMEILCLRIKY